MIAPDSFVLAYLDPGSGAILLQILVAGAAGVVVFLKFQGRRLKSIFTGKGNPPEDDSDES
jgi:hypothetical protein